jgi:hypothetical protein
MMHKADPIGLQLSRDLCQVGFDNIFFAVNQRVKAKYDIHRAIGHSV